MASSAASPVCNYEPMPGMDRPPRFGLVRGKAPSPSPVLTVRRPSSLDVCTSRDPVTDFERLMKRKKLKPFGVSSVQRASSLGAARSSAGLLASGTSSVLTAENTSERLVRDSSSACCSRAPWICVSMSWLSASLTMSFACSDSLASFAVKVSSVRMPGVFLDTDCLRRSASSTREAWKCDSTFRRLWMTPISVGVKSSLSSFARLCCVTSLKRTSASCVAASKTPAFPRRISCMSRVLLLVWRWCSTKRVKPARRLFKVASRALSSSTTSCRASNFSFKVISSIFCARAASATVAPSGSGGLAPLSAPFCSI
mmetsp:Transcript_14376/g.54218  ORF Transcript_14376/g.54218 Transcript_14376/m.54218 type:complete len:313 (-) Transcript_14376:158-1096(-)